ncbi:hypothetical protein ACFPRL_07975 [Pseudoclavibacter helvolus]
MPALPLEYAGVSPENGQSAGPRAARRPSFEQYLPLFQGRQDAPRACRLDFTACARGRRARAT